MKRRTGVLLSVLMAGILLAGCGYEEKMSVNGDLTVTATEEYYLTANEVLDYGYDPDEFKLVTRNGRFYYLWKMDYDYTHEEFENVRGRLDHNCVVLYPQEKNEWDILSDSDKQELGAELEFMNAEVELPFLVAETNAKQDGNKIILDKDTLLDNGAIYAVADTELLKGTALTITGASEGEIYNKKKTVSINTADGIIKSMGVEVNGTEKEFSDDEHPYNVTVCSKDGKYTISAELFSGTNQTLTFTVDQTKPKANVENNKTYKSGKKITFSDKTSGIQSAKLDGKNIGSGYKIKKKGTHKLVLTDKAGNKQTIKFKIK